ncbi:MAG: FAD-dependent oxidoreductase [Thermaerobacter sp.]|nr:FAD-dependent oxidoreductase [Thermaerobacter sp.]
MTEYAYVVVGAGMACDAAIAGIRRRDRTGSILVVGEEPFPPYQRPPLSKQLWVDMRLETVFLGSWTRYSDVKLALGTRVSRIDRANRQIETDDGRRFGYGKLLLATGARPRTLAGDTAGAYYVGSLAEHIRLMKALAETRTVLVVGGGFIGAEMAAVLSMAGHRVTWTMIEPHPFAGFFPDDLAGHVTDAYRAHGVIIVPSGEVTGVESFASGIRAVMKSGPSLEADLAVVGVGVRPMDELAQAADLEVDGGIVVNDYLRTSDEHIWAAGDVAVMAPEKQPMWHEDHAVTQGRLAGENLAGASKPYTHRPFYYSDLYQFGYEAIGNCRTSHHDIVEDWVTPGEEGVVYYLDGGHVVGVLNWNVWNGVQKAETLMDSGRRYTAAELVGQIRNAVE